MAYREELADRLRGRLQSLKNLRIEEKKTFCSLAYLVNGKMCVNVSSENLMCRYDPILDREIAERVEFEPMIMRGRRLRAIVM